MVNESVDSSRTSTNTTTDHDGNHQSQTEPQPQQQKQQQQQPQPQPLPKKVKVHFVAVGSAPIMKKNKFQIGAEERFAAVHTFLRKMLKLSGSGSSLFLYCHSSFVPSPDQLVGELNDCFSVRDELVIHYSLQEAWG